MQKAVGMLIHLSINTRLDITFTVNILSRYANSPTEAHWNVAKHLLRYLEGTSSIGLHFKRFTNPESGLCGWADADYATSAVSKKSTTGYVVTLFGNPICWVTKKQSVVAQSTTKAEFIAINICAKQMPWLSNLLLGLGIRIPCPTIMNDNRGANFLSKEAQLNPNSRHIEVCYQYPREPVANSVLVVRHCPSEEMVADVLTKPLGYGKVIQARKMLNLVPAGSRRSVSDAPAESPAAAAEHREPLGLQADGGKRPSKWKIGQNEKPNVKKGEP